MTDLPSSEVALAEARSTRAAIASKLNAASGRLAQARQAKSAKAFAAATGDATAQEALTRANERIAKAMLALEDLQTAHAEATARVAESEARVAALRDRERADQIAATAARFAEASATVDVALTALAQALAAREAVAQELLKLAPAAARAELSHRLLTTGSLIRAARHAGLGAALRLPWAGEKHHEAALAAVQFPEIEQLIAKLRGGAETGREEAA